MLEGLSRVRGVCGEGCCSCHLDWISVLLFLFCFTKHQQMLAKHDQFSAFHIEVLDCLRGVSFLGGIGWYNPFLQFC